MIKGRSERKSSPLQLTPRRARASGRSGGDERSARPPAAQQLFCKSADRSSPRPLRVGRSMGDDGVMASLSECLLGSVIRVTRSSQQFRFRVLTMRSDSIEHLNLQLGVNWSVAFKAHLDLINPSKASAASGEGNRRGEREGGGF